MTLIVNLTALYCSLFFLKLVLPLNIPVGKPLLLLLLLLYVRHILKTNSSIKPSKELCIIYFLMMSFLLWGGLNSDKIYERFAYDLRNAVTILLLIPILSTIYQHNLLEKFKSALAKITVITFLPVTIYSFYKFYRLLQGVQLTLLIAMSEEDIYPAGTSLQADYNMAALGLLSAFISSLYLSKQYNTNPLKKSFYMFVSVLTLAAALLTGSRRLIVVLGLLVGSFVIYKTIKLLSVTFQKRLISSSSAKVLTVSVLIFLVCVFVYLGQYSDQISTEQDEVVVIGRRYKTLYGGLDPLRESRGRHFNKAIELIDDFTIPQLLYGDGFDYLQKMSFEDREEYPHNPILSAILYGGLINGLLTVFFITRPFLLYLKNIKKEKFFFILFAIHFLFLSISSNSIFSGRTLLLLIIISFLFQIETTYAYVPQNTNRFYLHRQHLLKTTG